MIKFNNQYFEVPTKAAVNYYPFDINNPQDRMYKLHPYYDYESYLKSKSSLEKHAIPPTSNKDVVDENI